jgi:hypothetical protein
MSGQLQSLGLLNQGNGSSERFADYSAEWLSGDRLGEWDAYVLRHPLGTLYHTTEWQGVIERAFPHIRGRFLVLRKAGSGRIQAGVPVYNVKSWLLGNRLVSIPLATVCDPLVSTLEEWDALAPELSKEALRTNSKRLEIRMALSGTQLPVSFSSSSQFRHHVLPLYGEFNQLYAQFDKQSVRQKAEKARRAGVIVHEMGDDETMAVSYAILASTRRRLGLPPMPSRFFESLHSNLRPKSRKIFLAYHNSKPVACHLVLIYKDQWISEYSGNSDGAVSGVNQLLYLETIRQAWSNGARKFSFGRTSIHNHGLLAYKRRWGTIEEDLTAYSLRHDRANESLSGRTSSRSGDSWAYTLCKQMVAKSPLPMCKMIGEFCYRHLG